VLVIWLGNRINDQLEKRLTDNNLVTVLEFDRRTGGEARLAVDVGAVEASDVFDRNLATLDDKQRMPARNLGLGIVGVEVDLGTKFFPPSSSNSCPLRPPRKTESLALKGAAAAAAGCAGASLAASDALISPVGASDEGAGAGGAGAASAAAVADSAGAAAASAAAAGPAEGADRAGNGPPLAGATASSLAPQPSQ
jgi:hypothetical protein